MNDTIISDFKKLSQVPKELPDQKQNVINLIFDDTSNNINQTTKFLQNKSKLEKNTKEEKTNDNINNEKPNMYNIPHIDETRIQQDPFWRATDRSTTTVWSIGLSQ